MTKKTIFEQPLCVSNKATMDRGSIGHFFLLISPCFSILFSREKIDNLIFFLFSLNLKSIYVLDYRVRTVVFGLLCDLGISSTFMGYKDLFCIVEDN